jgi:hypothetical protein
MYAVHDATHHRNRVQAAAGTSSFMFLTLCRACAVLVDDLLSKYCLISETYDDSYHFKSGQYDCADTESKVREVTGLGVL